MHAEATALGGSVSWEYAGPLKPGQLSFPLNRLFAGNSFVIAASGGKDFGGWVSTGTLRVVFTARS